MYEKNEINRFLTYSRYILLCKNTTTQNLKNMFKINTFYISQILEGKLVLTGRYRFVFTLKKYNEVGLWDFKFVLVKNFIDDFALLP